MLMSAERSVLLLIDLQERLMPAVHDADAVVATAARLAEAAQLLDVPVLATEQYPAGLGPTVETLAGYPRETLTKTAFSAVADPGFQTLLPAGTREIVIAGCETHVCVLQTALDLIGSRQTLRDPAAPPIMRRPSTAPGSTGSRWSPPRWWSSSGSATRATPASARCTSS
jgi:nicotinamidase-related amidase